MSEPGTRRVLVAIEPVVLEGTFAVILGLIAVDEVVEYHAVSETQRQAHYDAAIVSSELAPKVQAEVVITLPTISDDEREPGRRRRGHVTTQAISDDVDIRDQEAVIDLLDEHLPGATSRRDRLSLQP
ncbi:MAG TPA: hypothetical protein VM933_04010 [Acidimicrobiales bacterium]|nr:hypothetical protein [Acidimicrobiales bacterium]